MSEDNTTPATADPEIDYSVRMGPAELVRYPGKTGHILHELRKRAGYTEAQAARIAGIAPATLIAIEGGNLEQLTVTGLFILSGAYGTAIETGARS